MKLYHATKKENAEYIIAQGLDAQISNKKSSDPRLNQAAIYGFDNLQDAIDFMVWDNNIPEDNIAVFVFETNNAIKDPEYDGNSYAILDENIQVKQVI